MSSKNYIIIGLGGTGGNIIKSFRKAVFEEFRSNTPPLPARIRYLYVDSSNKDLPASGKWRTQDDVGEDISLDRSSQFAITENNLAVRLQDPVHHPVTHRYIGPPAYWADLFASMNVSETAGGQIRRLGESLFEPKCGEFVEHVEHRMVRSMQDESSQHGVAFHVCAGLAGGTGSGTFLQVVAQLRKTFPDYKAYPIYLYLLLPERHSPWAKNGEATNYYANGYAALQELNAYLVSESRQNGNLGGALYSPLDLSGRVERLTGLQDRLQGVFLVSNVNEADRVMSVDKDMPQLFAHLIYQRIFQLDGADPSKYRGLLDAISLENLQTPDEAKQTDSNVKLRSIRYQTFGTKRIIVPEEEIREHFTATLATQACLQMRFNHWQAIAEGVAQPEYKAEKRPRSFKEEFSKEENRRALKIGNDHITLSEGILDNEISAKGWKHNDQHWVDIAPRFKDSAWSVPVTGARDVRLDKLAQEFQSHFDEFYRGVGVERFYNLKAEDLGQPDRHISELRDTIETHMMLQWTEGVESAADLDTYLDDLIADLEDRLKSIPGKLERLAQEDGEVAKKVAANVHAWSNLGLGGKLLPVFFKSPADVFEAQSQVLIRLYQIRTATAAWSFAKVLLQRLIAELRDKLKPELGDFRSGLDSHILFFDNRRNSTCTDEVSDLKENVVKFYQPEKTRKFATSLLEDEKNQKAWAGEARRAIIEIANQNRSNARGKERPFAALAVHAFRNGHAKAAQERVSRRQAEREHQNRLGSTGRFIGVNIVAKLAEQYPDNERLKQYVTELVASAQTFNRYRQVEMTRRPEAILAIILPVCDELKDFRDRLAQAFRECQPPGIAVHVVDSGRRANEITLLSFKYAFPLRYLEQVWYLKERFDERLKHGSRERALMEVYSEDHRPELPSLFRSPPGEAGERMLPLLQIVHALGHFQKSTSRQTGRTERFIELADAQGLPAPHYYPDEIISLLEPSVAGAAVSESEALLQVLRSISEDQVEILADVVSMSLKVDKYRLLDQREALKQLLRAQLDNVRGWREGDQRDPIYLKFRESTAASLLRIDQA
jgi:hypothetical protein